MLKTGAKKWTSSRCVI